MKPDITITQNIFDFIDDYLQSSDNRSIRPLLGEIIQEKLKNQCIVHIEWRSDSNQPVLWRYKAWKTSVELWERQKIASEERRKENFIFHENIKRTKTILMKVFLMDELRAEGSAYSMVKNKQWKKLLKFEVELCDKVEDVT